MPADTYVGNELRLFSRASTWKGYWARQILPFVSGRVLEVGAGLGANTAALQPMLPPGAWTCLEPDPLLAEPCLLGCRERVGETGDRSPALRSTWSDPRSSFPPTTTGPRARWMRPRAPWPAP